jgi:hypothetical protein
MEQAEQSTGSFSTSPEQALESIMQRPDAKESELSLVEHCGSQDL